MDAWTEIGPGPETVLGLPRDEWDESYTPPHVGFAQ